ncbi:hypothetical protein SAMN02744778_03105 [Pantoea sp. GL120224-02]|nr:hypothetical protein SAMN02744778_03105 [Pantoea sp. GL120224-02]
MSNLRFSLMWFGFILKGYQAWLMLFVGKERIEGG